MSAVQRRKHLKVAEKDLARRIREDWAAYRTTMAFKYEAFRDARGERLWRGKFRAEVLPLVATLRAVRTALEEGKTRR